MFDYFEKLDLPKIFFHTSRFTSTEIGKAFILNDSIAQNLAEAKLLQEITTEAKSYLESEGEWNLLAETDLTEAIGKSRIEGMILTTKEISQLLNLLTNSRRIKSALQNKENKFPNLFSLSDQLINDRLLEKRINEIIDDYGEVKDSASPDLKKIRQEIKSQKDHLQKIAEKILKRLSEEDIVQEELITLRDGRIVLPVKSEYKRQIKGFIHSESASGLTTYIEPEETLELNNEILSLHFREKREIQRILLLLTQEIARKANELLQSQKLVTKIDSIFAKAKYSIEMRASKVEFTEDRSFEIIDCRHPLLLQNMGFQKTVPFSLQLDGSTNCIVISGPNAGGKTVFMKAIGVISVLSKMGYHIPMQADSRIPFFSDVFIDIGDEQSIDNDISTFGSHLKRIKEIFLQSDLNSLVLIDEIGSGTDPSEGISLAAGVIKLLIEKGCFTIVTTHHSYLKLFAANHPKTINASMEFNLESLQPTYTFIQGIPGSSYAFEISERLELPKIILNASKEFRQKSDADIESYITSLQQKLSLYSKLLDEVKKEKIELDKILKEYNSKMDKIKSNEKEVKQKALEEALIIVKSANALIEKTVKTIKESKADSKIVKKYREQVKQKTIELEQKTREIYREEISIELKVGDIVVSKEQNIKGTLIEADKNTNNAVILVGNLRVKTKLNNLIKSVKSNEITERPKVFDILKMNISHRLDIRGKRAADAESKIQKYLDDATMTGLSNVEILHGKGDGILKNLVRDILEKHPFVDSFNPAPIEQGGEGVTLVKFKD